MKLEDLMLNDWVLHKGEPCKVVGINNRLYLERNERVFLASPQEVSPIPLTGEILEKNGFEKDGRYRYIYEDNYCKVCVSIGPNIEIDGEDLGEAPINVIIEGALFDNNMYMSAFHELQHALKLCGIDKAINL